MMKFPLSSSGVPEIPEKGGTFGAETLETPPDSNTCECARLCHGGAGIRYLGLADVLVISGDADLGLHGRRAASAFSEGGTSKLASHRMAAVTFLLLLHGDESAKHKHVAKI